MSANAFAPNGLTIEIACTSGATTGVRCDGLVHNATQRMVQNLGSKIAYLANGTSSVAAVVPTSSVPNNGIPILAGAVLVLSFPPGSYFSAICGGSDTTTLALTPGEGN